MVVKKRTKQTSLQNRWVEVLKELRGRVKVDGLINLFGKRRLIFDKTKMLNRLVSLSRKETLMSYSGTRVLMGRD